MAKRGVAFETDLAPMMYGFGGDDRPVTESLALLSDIVTGFVVRITHEGVVAAKIRGDAGLNSECLMYAFRAPKDAPKRARIRELMEMHEEIKAVRAKIDVRADDAGKPTAPGARSSRPAGTTTITTTTTKPRKKKIKTDAPPPPPE
jgi:hypothetical protein